MSFLLLKFPSFTTSALDVDEVGAPTLAAVPRILPEPTDDIDTAEGCWEPPRRPTTLRDGTVGTPAHRLLQTLLVTLLGASTGTGADFGGVSSSTLSIVLMIA